MKNYIKYKKFLPKEYIEENIQQNRKSNKKAVWILVALNLYLLPINMNNFFDNHNDNEEVMINYNSNEKFINEILQWIKLNDFKVESVEAEGEKGTIKVQDKDILCDLEEAGYSILSITKEDTIYKASISKDD